MAEKCAVCGKKLGGIMGVPETSPETIQTAVEKGFQVPTPICTACFYSSFDPALSAKTEIEKENAEKLRQAATLKATPMPLFTVNPYSEGSYTSLGIVSAHIAMGTGLVNQALSSITDLFGTTSGSYGQKLRDSENACLLELQMQACERGATEIIGIQTTYTELTAGHGILLVAMIGTAIKR